MTVLPSVSLGIGIPRIARTRNRCATIQRYSLIDDPDRAVRLTRQRGSVMCVDRAAMTRSDVHLGEPERLLLFVLFFPPGERDRIPASLSARGIHRREWNEPARNQRNSPVRLGVPKCLRLRRLVTSPVTSVAVRDRMEMPPKGNFLLPRRNRVCYVQSRTGYL